MSDTSYFDNYTGIKDHGKTLSGWFSNVHETRIRLNYTYYNSPDIMGRIFDWYNKIDPDGRLWDYTVIDDGSQTIPITEINVPKHWTVLRIEKDHGWNNEGAKNCLMRDTTNKWNFLLDSDWVISARCLHRVQRNVVFLDNEFVYFPGNFGPKVGRNSYLVSKPEFWSRGGYDQAFVGYHGVDYSFLRFNMKYDYSEMFWFIRTCDDVVDPNEKNRMEEVKRFHNLMIELEEKGYGYRCPHDKQDFIWTDLDKKQEMWTHLEYVRLQ